MRAIVLFALIAVGLVGCPRYEVYYQQMTGQAEFARAEQNRRIKIEEAKANLEAEKLNAQAEIERAKGAAEANLPILEAGRGATAPMPVITKTDKKED